MTQRSSLDVGSARLSRRALTSSVGVSNEGAAESCAPASHARMNSIAAASMTPAASPVQVAFSSHTPSALKHRRASRGRLDSP